MLIRNVTNLLKGVLKQCLSGHRDLYMAGQGIGLHRDRNKKVRMYSMSTVYTDISLSQYDILKSLVGPWQLLDTTSLLILTSNSNPYSVLILKRSNL